ncbi:MAG: hypothetical protein GEU71_12435 [Actinobacteria bacterium]|nr:hypothetical protein [Actinomycetota bacterium]
MSTDTLPPTPPRDVAWERSWNEVQLVFADGTVSSLAPGGELQVRMVRLARKMLSEASDTPAST